MTALLTSLFGALSPLWAMSLTAAYVAAVVILLRLILKKRAPRRVLCLLWLVVFARLLIPVTVESPLSIVPDEARVQQIQDLPPGLAGGGPVLDPTSGQDLPAGSAAPVTQENPNPGAAPVLTAPDGTTPTPPQTPAAFPWQALAAGVWLAGVLTMCLYGLISSLRLKASLRYAIRAGDGAWEHPSVRSPFILGIFRPRIYLPAGLAGTSRDFILCHERAHLRRLDHVVKPVCWLALALHWFNPLVWLAFVLMSRDIEIACDEAVIRQLGPQVKADYSATLLSLATNGRVPAPCPLAFDEGNAKGRIKNVLHYRRPALWIIVVSVLMVIAAAVCLLTDPMAAGTPDPDVSASQPPEEPSGPLEPWMEEVLNGERSFRSGEEDFNIHQLRTMVYGDGELPELTLEVGKLTILDLDRDGASEMVVWPTGEHDDPTEVGYSTGYFIFRRTGDAVRVYYPGWRSVGELKADGTFDWSNTAFNWGTGTLGFSDAGCTISQLTWCGNTSAEDEHYFVDGVTATREQFEAAITAQSDKDEPVWYVFEDGQLKYAPIDVPIPLDYSARTAPVPDFLDADQQLLYRQMYSLYGRLFGGDTAEVDNWPGQYGYDFDAETDLVYRGIAIYAPATGRYASWSDFRQAVLSVFTRDYWDSRNGAGDIETYININGTLYYQPAARGSGGYYNENFPETFRLVERTDDTISFVMTGYYSEGHLLDGETSQQREARRAAGWEYSIDFPMRMVKTEQGWRFDEFHRALTDDGVRPFCDQQVPNPNAPSTPDPTH